MTPDEFPPSEKNDFFWCTSRWEVLDWCEAQGVLPLPCKWGTKGPHRAVTEKALIDAAPDCGTFLVDHPYRRKIIHEIWTSREKRFKRLNISLVCGWDGVCSIDCDSGITMQLADSFVYAPRIKSKKGGKLIFRLVGDAPTLVQYKNALGDVELEFFSRNKHVLIYGMHPDKDAEGKDIRYKFYPADIPTLTWEQLHDILLRIASSAGLSEIIGRETPKKKIETDIISKAFVSGTSHNFSDWFNLPCPEPDNAELHGDELQGSHPVHGSTTRNNFTVDIRNGTWYCHRCKSGGDRFLWLLVENKIITCDQAMGGWKGLSQDQLKQANILLKTLYPDRYEDYWATFPRTVSFNKSTDVVDVTTKTLPKSLPDHTITVIHGLPRIGKTDRMIDWLISEDSGTYVSATHSVILNAAMIMEKKWGIQNITNQTAVIVVGKSYACNNDGKEKCNCRNCTKFPGKNSISTGLSFIDYKIAGNQLLTELKMLTPDNIPVDYCPYYLLQLAKINADFKFTVPFFTTVDNPFLKVEPGALTVIDEDPTIDYYRPKPLLIATYYSYIRDGGGVVIPHLGKTTIPDLKKLKKYIESKAKKLSDVDQVIVEIIQKFLQIHGALTTFNKSPTKSTKEWFDDNLKNINFTNNLSHESKLDVLKTVVKYISASGIKSADLPAVFEPALFPYEKTFSWQGTSPQSLFFIADNSLFKIPDFNRLVLVGGIRAELFAQDLAEKKEIADLNHIVVSEFSFIQNYIVIRLNGPSEERIKQLKEANPDIKIDIPKAQRNQLQTLLQKTAGRNRKRSSRYPALIVTSSERKQEELAKRLGECSAMCKDHGIKSLWGFYLIGTLVIFYENSIISRGLDIPFFDQLFLDCGSFATPYWTARKQHFKELIEGLKDKTEITEKTSGNPEVLKENYKEEIEKINDIISTIQCDETTNCVLRAAPIHQNSSTERLKVIIIRDTDFYSKLDINFSSRVTSITITDDDDSDALLDTLEDVSHAPTPTDENLDREKPTSSGSETILHPQVVHKLIDLRDRLLNFTLPSPWRVDSIDRKALPYERFIHILKYIPSLRRIGKSSGHGGTITLEAISRRCRKKFNEQITDKTIKECIRCALDDRILLEKRDGGNVSYYFHDNVLATFANAPNTGPAYPVSLAILVEDNEE